MYVYAEDSHVIFECQYCGFKQKIHGLPLDYMSFLRGFNLFRREHLRCMNIKPPVTMELAEKITADILKNLQAVQ